MSKLTLRLFPNRQPYCTSDAELATGDQISFGEGADKRRILTAANEKLTDLRVDGEVTQVHVASRLHRYPLKEAETYLQRHFTSLPR